MAPVRPGATPVGFLGLGIMGEPMARNLSAAGYPLVAWNRTPGKAEALAAGCAAGGGECAMAASPAEVTARAGVTFAMLSDPEAAQAVVREAADGLGPGKGYVDCSTVDASTAEGVGAAVAAAGGKFLEAPVSGSKAPAENGQLIFLCGGSRDLFDDVAGPLEVMGKSSLYLGETGQGARMKLCANAIMGEMMVALSEGLALSEAAGLKHADLLEVLSIGAMANPMFALKGPAMSEGTYPPAFPLEHQQKDLRLALALGEEVGQPLPLAAAANAAFLKAQEQGLARSDFSAVMEVARRRARLE